MNKISLFTLLIAVSVIPNANAASQADGAAYRTKWAVADDFPTCKGSGADAGFDGSSANVKTDKKWRDYLKANFTESGKGHWGYGAWYWIAHEMNEHGYKFCKTAVGADRSGITKSPFTNYVAKIDATEDAGENCFWLCEKGYYGKDCGSLTPSATEPDSKGNDFSIIANRATIAAGLNANPLDPGTVATLQNAGQKNNIPMFFYDKYTACSGGAQVDLLKMSQKQEHNVVLAIKNIETDGVTRVKYTLQPMVVRAGSAKNYAHTGWPMISWTGAESADYCPNEKFLHSDEGGCVGYSKKTADLQEINRTDKVSYDSALEQAKMIENAGLDILCPGFDRTMFNNNIHELNSNKFEYKNWRVDGENAAATCTVFVCKDGKGYASDPKVSGNWECVNCKNIANDASVHPSRLGLGSDGVCVTCATAEIYDEDSQSCVQARVLTQYGMIGITTPTQQLDDQCWTKSNPDDYKSCVSGQ